MLLTLLAAYVALWLLVPARAVHGDALDELSCIEAPSTMCVLPRHAAVESSLWIVYRALVQLGYQGRALRIGQLWNGLWMTLALVAVWRFARRETRSALAAVGVTLWLAGLYVSLHLALDPFLLYWPPGLALMTWALATADGSPRSGARSACLTLAIAVTNAMALAGAAVATVRWLIRGPRTVMRALAGASWLGAAALASQMVQQRIGGAESKYFGRWAPLFYRSVSDALGRFFFPPSGAPPGLAMQAGEWLVVAACGAALLWLVVGALFGARRLESLAWLGGVVGSFVFVAWWDPGQEFFYLLPVWLTVLGATATMPIDRARGWSLCFVGAVAMLLSVGGYAFGTARDGSIVASRAAQARAFSETDVVVEPAWQDLHLVYYFHRPSIGLLTLFATRAPGESTMAALDREVAAARARGGQVYLHTLSNGRPFPPPVPDADWSEADLLRRTSATVLRRAGSCYRELGAD